MMFRFTTDAASLADLLEHLQKCDNDFDPPLSSRVGIENYAMKMLANARRFEAWDETGLAGLVTVYCNDPQRQRAFITNVSVLSGCRGSGLADSLLERCLDHLRSLEFRYVELEVGRQNPAARRLYVRHGFACQKSSAQFQTMQLVIRREVS